MQENPESQEKKNTKGSFFEVPGVVKADKTEKPAAKPEKKIEQKVTEEPLVREEPKESAFKTSGVETGYTQESWAKPEKSMEGKEAVDTSTLEREKPEGSDFKAPGEHETGYTEKSWAKPEETEEARAETGKEPEGEKRKEAGEEKRTTYS
ncbi:MAG TPA: hypothetical protein VN278_05225, partial [Methanosarcina sp.]|nr:hypothetical protein [Methanosarcina sp.]